MSIHTRIRGREVCNILSSHRETDRKSEENIPVLVMKIKKRKIPRMNQKKWIPSDACLQTELACIREIVGASK